MSEVVSAVSILTELQAGSTSRASGVLALTELQAGNAARTSSVMILVEVLDPIQATGIMSLTLNSRTAANTLRTRRKTYTTLNERTSALTLEERP